MTQSFGSGSILFFLVALVFPALSQTPEEQLARSIFEQLVNINTADSAANVTSAAEAMAQRLREAGFPEEDIHVDGDDPRFKNLVVRYHGAGRQKPILIAGSSGRRRSAC